MCTAKSKQFSKMRKNFMSKRNKVSFYDIEDVEKIGIIDDNINCNAKNFLNICHESIPFLLILCFSRILPVSELISNIISIILSIQLLAFNLRIHRYDRIINFELFINEKQIKYKNEQGKNFVYNVNELINAKWHHHRYIRTALILDTIEINMKDSQKIWISARDKNFYKLVMYLEQKELFIK